MDYKYRSDFKQVLSLEAKKNCDNIFREQVREQFFMLTKLPL